MTSISGKTKNGFTYEGDYEQGSTGRVLWNATYRRGGDFYGIRHGRLNELLGVSMADIDIAVKNDIESTWIESSG